MPWREELRRRLLTRRSRLVVGLVSGSHFLNHMFLVLLPPIFGVLATEFELSLAQLGLAVSAMSLTSTAFQVPFGYLSDNVSRTATLVSGLAAAAAGVFLIAGAQGFPELLVGQILLGVGIGAHHPANYPLVSAATADENRAWAYSIHDTAGHLGYGAAPAFLVAVMALPGRTWRDAFFVVAIVSALYAVLALLVLVRSVPDEVTRSDRSNTASTTSPSIQSLVDGARRQVGSLLDSPAVLALTVLALVVSMAGWGFRSFTVVLLTDGYGYDLATANTALTVMFVGSAFATLVSGLLTDRFSATTIIIPAYLLIAVVAVAVGTLAIPAIVAAAIIVLGASGHSMGNPPRNKLLDRLSEQSDLGVNFAVITVGVTLGGSIAPPLFGVLIDTFGFWAAFYVIGGFGLLAVAIIIAIVRAYDLQSPIKTPMTSDD